MDSINEDVQRYILSFLNLKDYQSSKLYLKDTTCKDQEEKLQLFQALFQAIPTKNMYSILGRKDRRNQKQLLWEVLIQDDRIDFECADSFLDLELKRKIQQHTSYKIAFYRKTHATDLRYHFLLWKV